MQDMERHPFGTTDRAVAVIGQGTWYIDSGDRSQAIAALRLGVELGMDHIDTAEMYGAAEEVVADAIAGRRDEVFLVSKVMPETPPAGAPSAPVSAPWSGSIPAPWAATSCTGPRTT